ncbi:hypothetical protein D3C85_1019280 [compost metagenome]
MPGVVEGGIRVVDGAGTDHHQQAGVLAIQHGTHGVALGTDLAGELMGQRQALAQFGRGGQRLGAA